MIDVQERIVKASTVSDWLYKIYFQLVLYYVKLNKIKIENVVEYHSCIAVIGAENEICVLRSNSGRGCSFHLGTISILQSLSSQEQHCSYFHGKCPE